MSCDLHTWIDTIEKLNTNGDTVLDRYKKGVLESITKQESTINSEEIKNVILDKIEKISKKKITPLTDEEMDKINNFFFNNKNVASLCFNVEQNKGGKKSRKQRKSKTSSKSKKQRKSRKQRK
jgi:hypothetical protein